MKINFSMRLVVDYHSGDFDELVLSNGLVRDLLLMQDALGMSSLEELLSFLTQSVLTEKGVIWGSWVDVEDESVRRLMVLAEKRGIKLEELVNEILAQECVKNKGDSEVKPSYSFDSFVEKLIQRRQCKQEWIARVNSEKDEKYARAKDVLNKLVLPVLAEASQSLESNFYKMSISDLAESHTLNDVVHYRMTLSYLNLTDYSQGNLTFIMAPENGKLGARSSGKVKCSYKRIDIYAESVYDYVVSVVYNFLENEV